MQIANSEVISSNDNSMLYKQMHESAKFAQLHYVNNFDKGITRKRHGKNFTYFDKNGVKISNKLELARIKSLAIPPAWNDIWICTDTKGHLQATGIDFKGRKQYRYHPKWRLKRDEIKFEHMLDFALQLPDIRAHVQKVIAGNLVNRERVIAMVVYLLEKTLIRIGNSAYAQENNSFGLTTMRNRHVAISGSDIKFRFRGKSGVEHTVKIQDRRISRMIWKLKDIPGQNLFQYLDDENSIHAINSSDVNDYLKEITGKEYTAKDFRTWYGTFYAVLNLTSYAAFVNQAEAKQNVVNAVKFASEKLGNTPSICKKCYIHPLIIDQYMSGELFDLAVSVQAISDEKEAHKQVENYIINILKDNASGS